MAVPGGTTEVPKVDELVVVLITVVISAAIATDVYVTEDHTVVTIAQRYCANTFR